VDAGEKVGGFIVTGRDSSELLELTDEILDHMARLVQSLSKSRSVLRELLGGITGVLPAARRGLITRSSASNALWANTVSAFTYGKSTSASCAG